MTEPILLNGEWQASTDMAGDFRANNPARGKPTGEPYPVSDFGDLQAMLEAAQTAVKSLREAGPGVCADFLDAYADAIEANKDAIIEAAHTETALPAEGRLPGELNRTTDQLRQAADAARNGTWARVTIDSETNIRSMFEPLGGAVIVLGPNNFPLAFNGISGGDFAAAIAAGNPVIAKAHPAHPRTTQLLAEAALSAIEETDAPPALVQMFYHTSNENGLALVAHRLTGATAFTGGPAGLDLKRAADAAGKPIYLEMSSVNPVFMLPGALAERGKALAAEFVGSCTLGAGQFCTNPGLVIVPAGEAYEAFEDAVLDHMADAEQGMMLTPGGPDNMAAGVKTWEEHGAKYLLGGQPDDDADGFRFQETLMTVDGATFLENAKALQTEAFGVASLFVIAEDGEQMVAIAQALQGNLTGSVYSHTGGDDNDLYDDLAPVLAQSVGRLLNDQMPTGVTVVAGTVHGGPFPATGHPGFTAVGIPWALQRFAKLTCYENVWHDRLPAALQNANPNGDMFRFVDGEWTQDDVDADEPGPPKPLPPSEDEDEPDDDDADGSDDEETADNGDDDDETDKDDESDDNSDADEDDDSDDESDEDESDDESDEGEEDD